MKKIDNYFIVLKRGEIYLQNICNTRNDSLVLLSWENKNVYRAITGHESELDEDVRERESGAEEETAM